MKKHFGKRRPRLLRSLMSLVAVALVAFGLPLVTMSAASAHILTGSATCSGISTTASYYNSSYHNSLEVWIDGVLKYSNYDFGSGITVTVPVPKDDGATHTWRRKIYTPEPGGGSFNHDDSGTVGPCGTKHVTATLWSVTPPTCDADGALVRATEPEGITATQNPSGTGPANYSITFSAKPGFAIDGTKSQQLVVLPKLTGDQCAAVVQPVAPTITNPTCTGPGTGTPGSITLPANGGGISYSKSDTVVTATADATHKFVTLPSGWTPVDAHHATYTVTYTDPSGYPACVEQLPTPVPPVASAPTCDTDGDLVVGTTPHVVTRVDGTEVTTDTHFGPGSHELTYTAASGYTFASGTTKTFSVGVKGKTLDCPVTPVNPTVTQSVCNGPGSHTDPVVTFGDVEGDHIGYAYDAGTHVVTATPDPGFKLVDLPDGWRSHEDGTATYLVTLVDPGPCLVEVDVPTPPAATAPTCSTDGSLTVSPTDHVVTTVDDTVIEGETSFGPGEHTIDYAPAEGYTFAGEPQTSFPVNVLPATLDCPTGVVSPTVTQSVCTGPGTHSDPVVTLGDVEGDHVSYVYDAASRTVTAKPDTGFALANLPTGWVLQESGGATYLVTLTDPGLCLVTVSPPTSPTVQVKAPTHHPTVLPNTGGPTAWLALGGLVLLLAGGGLVVRERRLR